MTTFLDTVNILGKEDIHVKAQIEELLMPRYRQYGRGSSFIIFQGPCNLLSLIYYNHIKLDLPRVPQNVFLYNKLLNINIIM